MDGTNITILITDMFINQPLIVDGFGDWSIDGCIPSNITLNETEGTTVVVCSCTHFTSFSMLLVRIT